MADNTTLNTGSGGDTIATDDIAGVKYPRSKIVIGADGTNDGDVSATNPLPVKGTGTAGTANSGVVTVQGIASMTPVQVGDNSGSLTVDAPVGTPVFVRLSDGSAAISALPVTDNGDSLTVDNAGTFAVQAAQSGTWTVQPGNTANTTAWLVADQPTTSGGLTNSSFLSTAAVQATAIKASAGQVYSIEFFNVGTTPVYVRLYNQATTPGTGDAANIIWRGMVPADSGSLGAGFVKTWDKGLAFSSGIGMRVSGAIADNDATALSANVVLGNVAYK